jgi:transposase
MAIRLRESGMKYKEIGQILGIHFTTVCELFKKYERDGPEAIRFKKRGRKRGSGRTLSPEQEKEIQNIIRKNCPDHLNLPYALWNRVAIQQLVKLRFSINIPIRTVGEYLKR